MKPVKIKPYAHQSPRSRLTTKTGTLKHYPWRTRRKPQTVPTLRPTAAPRTFSTRSALYRFHKANGTLHVYYRMFGLDYVPE